MGARCGHDALHRAVLAAIFILVPFAPTHAQEWTDTRVGPYDFICESLPAGSAAGTVGTFISGHQRFSLAARSCAAAAQANPALVYQVRPATYKITLTKSPATPPPPTEATYALSFDPTCTALVPIETTVGVAFVSPSLRACLGGSEAASALASLKLVSGSDPIGNGLAIGADGKISLPGTAPASGRVTIVFTAASGVSIEFDRNWQVQP